MKSLRLFSVAVVFFCLSFSCRKEVRPVWSHYFPEEDFSLLRETLDGYIADRKGKPHPPDLDWTKATVEWGGETLDLRELIGFCYFAKPEEYATKISNSFSTAEKQLELLSKHRRVFNKISGLLSLKMIQAADAAGLVARNDVPGVATLLVYDLGMWSLPVPRKDLETWQLNEAALFQEARLHLLSQLGPSVQLTTEEPLPGFEQTRYKKIFSHSSRTAALVLGLNEMKDLTSERGFLFSLPDWNTILFIPLSLSELQIRSSGLIKESIEQMNRSPFPLSSNYYLMQGREIRQIPFVKTALSTYLPSFPESIRLQKSP